MATKLSDRDVKELPAPPSGNRVHFDTEVKGFGVRVTKSGARAFVLDYRAAGRQRRITIGSFPDWPVKDARDEAARLKRRVDDGEDPMAQRLAERHAPTVAGLADLYREVHLPKKRPGSRQGDESLLRLHILPKLGKLQVAALRHTDLAALHREVTANTGPIAANRTTALLHKMLTLAVQEEWITTNPADGIERNPENKRERFLSPAEIARLSAVLASHPERHSANAVRLLLLTGARRGEVLGARWEQFDLTGAVWVKPAATTKQKKSHRLPLSAPALALLNEMRAEADADDVRRAQKDLPPNPFLFPGVEGKPLNTIKRFWLSACKKAGLATETPILDAKGRPVTDKNGTPKTEWKATARIHDLRHTFASVLASSGMSLPVIGALLGHTQPITTARYAHLLDDPLRAATERAASVIMGAGRPAADVVPLTKRKG